MKQFTVLSHNVYWLQGAPFEGDQPPAPNVEILRRLCAIYGKAGADVICLQEIQSRDAFEMVSKELGMPGCYCRGKELRQYGGAVFWHPDRGRHCHDVLGVASGMQRMWQVVEVTHNNRRLQLCNIHLPSKRQLSHEQATAQRVAELRNAIRGLDTPPDLIVGDFNEPPAGPAGEYLEAQGYVDAAVHAGRAELLTLGNQRLDYIWIKQPLSDCLLTYDVAGADELACEDIGKHHLSDHLPLWISLAD